MKDLAGAGVGAAVTGRIDALAEVRSLPAAALARRARAARDWPACRGHALGAVRLLVGGSAAFGEPVLRFEPSEHGLGGFFTGVVVTASTRAFAKCVLTRSREAAFWTAWREGAVRTEGSHYRILTPLAVMSGRVVTCLIFPELTGLGGPRRRQAALYRRNIGRVVRAMADFNSDHPLQGDGPFRRARGCEGAPVPSRRQVEAALKVDPARARDIVAALRRIEPRWPAIRDRVERGPRCLGHMDLGAGNVAFEGDCCVLLDLGAAGAAPVGADFHTVLRYGGAGRPGTDELAAAYTAVFEQKGVRLDRDAVRRCAEAHFAARYRNLRFAAARHPGHFAAALAASEALLGERPAPA